VIASDPIPVTIKGRAAQMRVIRNSGFCWGRIIYPDNMEADVHPQRDFYNWTDEEAVRAMERHANRKGTTEVLGSWRFGWEQTSAQTS
jgi:hypothetical protein